MLRAFLTRHECRIQRHVVVVRASLREYERHLKLIFASFLLGKDGKSGTESAGRIFPRAGARARVHSLLVLAQADQQLTKERMKDAEG
jgi:hypothetical protein